jgi:hypothetical protein
VAPELEKVAGTQRFWGVVLSSSVLVNSAVLAEQFCGDIGEFM